MTQTALMDRIRATSHAITCQVSGELVEWRVKPSQKVGRWETLAIVQDGAGLVEVTSEQPGTIKALMLPIGSRIEAGAVVAYFQPEHPPKPRQEARRADLSPVPVANGKPPAAPHSALQSEFKPPMPRRRGALPAAADLARVEVEELAITPETPTRVGPEPIGSLAKSAPKATKRERVKHRGVYLLPSQEQAIKRLVAGLSLDDDEPINTNDSEIIRAALDSFLSMTPAAQRATLQRYKASERKLGVGGGWPRPGRAGSKE